MDNMHAYMHHDEHDGDVTNTRILSIREEHVGDETSTQHVEHA
jgi:hypothetical protein